MLVLVQKWPSWFKLAACAIAGPTLGFVLGANVASWFMIIREPITFFSWLVFSCPASLAVAAALYFSKPRLTLLGVALQPGLLVWACVINHASFQRAVAFWPAMFPAVLGPLAGIYIAIAVHHAIRAPGH